VADYRKYLVISLLVTRFLLLINLPSITHQQKMKSLASSFHLEEDWGEVSLFLPTPLRRPSNSLNVIVVLAVGRVEKQ
jgi:hypothetical protein